MTLSFSSSTPSSGTTDFFINKSIELVFNEAISSATLTSNIVALVNINTNAVCATTLSLKSTDSSTIIVTPSYTLEENSDYRISVMGLDMGLGISLEAANGDALPTTVVITFATGSTVYKIDTTVEKEVANLTLEGDLFLPTNVKALGYDFTVAKVRPKNNTMNNAVTLTGDSTIRFTFSKELYSGVTDYDDWVTVDTFPLLNEGMYLASGVSMDLGTSTIFIPDYTISVSSTDLLVSFDGILPMNVGIQVTLSNGITSSDGDNYGGNMLYSINTQLFPAIYGVNTVAREVKEIASSYTDDYIGALLFKNSIWLWERLGRAFDITNPPYAAKQYVLYSTILDLMEDKEYEKYILAGTRRQLGDLNVSVDNIIGRLAMKVAKYQKMKDTAFESLIAGWQFRVGTSTLAYDQIAAQINRLWYDVNGRYTDNRFSYYQADLPVSNTDLNRRARINNPLWW